ncbi:MAG: polar amino acid transport system substrate-binding protein [Hyphomicrobiales bacterium]|jgi:polar amino acid transport system substrate-binding protein|nr:polar amino acid transport system substrate-binding protein [Hyphomicrobiales bacterium]
MIRTVIAALALAAASPACADDLARTLAPTGTLRAVYIAANPVQAFVDPATKDVRGPGAEIARELAKRAGVPVTIAGVRGADGVLEAVTSGAADIGFLAFDAVRAA